MEIDTTPQQQDIQYNRVYRRSEFAERPPKWSSPLPSLEIIGDGGIQIYVSNLPRQLGSGLYTPPIEDTLVDIQAKMTLLTPETCPLYAGFHDSCMCSVWIAFVWVDGSSVEPPILRDACLLDWELDTRRRGLC